MKFFLLSLLFISTLFGNKVIYSNYENTPKRVVKGEIFPVTLKSLSTVRDFKDIDYKFLKPSGVEVLTKYPKREKKGKYFYDTFYLLATKSWAALPDVKASLIASKEYNATIIKGSKLNVITLNPKNNFSNIVAKNFELLEYKTTSFDATHNIIVFVATAENSNIKAIHFNNVFKQGIESISQSYLNSRVTYFLVIDKKVENFTFSYFNLSKNKFLTLSIPIVVNDDSVTTQSDLKPKDQSHERIKMTIAGVIALLFFVFVLWRRKYIYLIFVIIPLIYIAYLAVPEKEICIKEGASIRLLPVENGTIFETTQSPIRLLKEGEVKNFIKVQLLNERIGWVKNEDICQD
jgi:hypothetical protein